MKIIFVFALILSFNAPAVEDFRICAAESECACPVTQTPVPTRISVRNRRTQRVHACRPVVQIATIALESSPAQEVICDPVAPDTLFTRMANSFPPGCGYNLQNFNADGFRETIGQYLQNKEVLCNSQRNHSMCTSAAFLAFLSELRRLKDLGLITEEKIQELSDLRGIAWNYINHQARPDLLLTELGLGTGRTIRKNEFPVEGWPKEGDLLQIWREDQSGHSVVFGGYLKDSQGTIQGICYWSSNLSTNGYGRLCEPVEVVNRMIVARFNS